MPYQCNSCKTEVIWLRHYQTGKPNPIEAAPSKNGNLVISRENGLYRFATPSEIESARLNSKNLYISHFATCEFAKLHSTKGR